MIVNVQINSFIVANTILNALSDNRDMLELLIDLFS